MLAPIGGGLILYQAYGNLYAMTGRKAHLLEDKQIPSVGVFDEVFSTWMAFGGNTRDLGSFGEETDKITDLHQFHEEVLFIERGDGVAGITRHRRDLSSDDVRDLATTQTIDQSAGGKLRNRNAEESWALLEDLTLYDNEIWNDPRDFAKPVTAITLPQDVLSTSDHRLIKLKNQVQRLMEAHLALMQPTQVNKVTTSCEICSGPHDTQYCMEDPEHAFVDYTSLSTDEAGVLKAITNQIAGTLPSDTVKNPKLSTYPVLSARSYPTKDPQCSTHVHGSINAVIIHPKQQSDSHDDRTEESEEEENDNPENIHVNPSTPPDLSVSFITEKVLKLNSFFESLGLVPQSSNTKLVCTKGDDGDVMFIED
ncbi:hypothetical protein Tco_0640076 [Tanacetum coccineum]